MPKVFWMKKKELTEEEIREKEVKSLAEKNIEKFKSYMLEKSYSQNTINSYAKELELFSRWNENSCQELGVILREDVLKYKNFLQVKLRQSAKTVNHKLSALKKYNEHLIENGKMDSLVVIGKDMIKLQKSYLNPSDIEKEEVIKFLNDIKQYGNLRDYAMAYLMSITGMRVQEMASIQMKDIDFDKYEVTIVKGKGNKQRTVFLNSEAVKAIKKYINKERCMPEYKNHFKSPYLFITRKSDKLSTSGVNIIFKKFNEKIHPHKLRHWFCSNGVKNNMRIEEVAYIAGHASLNTTALYIHPSKEDMKKSLNNFI